MQVSTINFNSLKKAERFDAEFFSATALENDKLLLSKPYLFLSDIVNDIVSGPFGSTLKSESYLSSGMPFVRIQDLQNFFISDNSLMYISEKDNNRILNSQLSIGDLVLSKVGNTIGVVAKVTENIGQCNISENNIGIKLVSLPDIDKDFMLAFLNSRIGQIQILRRISGNAQPKLNVSDIGSIIIPKTTNNFKKVISKLIGQVKSCIDKSKLICSQAEQLLLEELGLSNWQAKHKLSFVKNFSETEEAKRIDAEYFQPKYDQIIKSVKKYKGGWDILDNLVKITKSIEPGSSEYKEEGIKFLRISNLSKFGLDNSSPVYLSEKFYKENKQHQPKEGEILLSKDATPGIAYYLNEKPEEMIVSGGILRLKLKDSANVNEDCLTLVLNSLLVQLQAERDAGGSVIKHWRPDQIKNIIIPLLDKPIQTRIQQKIRQSFEARHKSKQLLEVAKKAVEMAIEKDEEAAMKWIEFKVKS